MPEVHVLGGKRLEEWGAARSGDFMSSAHSRDLALSKPAFPASGLPEMMRGKYRLRILWDLRSGSRRFGEIRKGLRLEASDTSGVAPRVLSRELKSLVELELVHRRAYDLIPPRVEYRLTPLGRSLLPVISTILEWGARHPSAAAIIRPKRKSRSAHPLIPRPNGVGQAPAEAPQTTRSARDASRAWSELTRR
jgi:DNA-binding HxlR family transcriptional regulator